MKKQQYLEFCEHFGLTPYSWLSMDEGYLSSMITQTVDVDVHCNVLVIDVQPAGRPKISGVPFMMIAPHSINDAHQWVQWLKDTEIIFT